ncbi:MAG TPA: Crp/Fnr family transcriptional regulator [Allosphingosinicella sp.]|nr:Crp/Fnr family transcriptional regulator [Allosphingosinicella sp.]
MSRIQQNAVRNLLLSRLKPDDYGLIQPYLCRVPHPNGHWIARTGTPLDSVCFPEGGVCALLIPMREGHRLAVGMIGYEGLVGTSLFHGAREWRHDVVVRAADTSGLCIAPDRLLDACRQSPSLQDLLLRFAGYFTLQVSRATVTNLIEPLERRMARWILLYHDRLEGDEIPMTHDEIGIMLGVRRASATDVLHVLEGLRAIRSDRGRVVVRDRRLLEELAGETYGDAEADYRRMIGPFGKSACSAKPAVGPVLPLRK